MRRLLASHASALRPSVTVPFPQWNGNERNDVYIVRGSNDPRVQRLVRIHLTSGEVDTCTVNLSPCSGKV